MKLSSSRRFISALSCPCLAIAWLFGAISSSGICAGPPLPLEAAPRNLYVDERWGGALETSFQYHRHGGPAAGPHAGGPYRYGFPVSSHRWGWFGASRYYPTVVWHRGFNGDHKRWAYRHGY